MKNRSILSVVVLGALLSFSSFTSGSAAADSASSTKDTRRFVQVAASDRHERSRIADTGMSIESVRSDSVWGFADVESLKELKKQGFRIMSDLPLATGRGGHEGILDFPTADARYHNYAEMTEALNQLAERNKDIARVSSIGKSLEGRDILAININSNPSALESGTSNKPGAIFMGAHHAREHLSVEMPLMLAEYLLKNRTDTRVASMIENRDIWIIPMVNPDGAEFDIKTGKYQMWRKNRRKNDNGTMGVDLNRNYGYHWGTGGSSSSGSSETYMGKEPFSEPETQVIRDFVDAHLNAKVLLTYHTFSELVLYPWGYQDEPMDNAKDLAVFETMAKTMAGWNHYTPEQSSALYITSGDTTDWAYGTHGIFAFTFELSPRDMWSGGFYPGAKIIDKVFQDNLKPALYMIDLADDPYRATTGGSSWLKNYVEPGLTPAQQWETDPLRF